MPYEAKVGEDVQPSVDVPLAVTPQQLGAGVGDAVQHLGETATDVHLREIDHANRTNVLDADNQQQAFIQARLHDPKTGILNLSLGKDAPAAVDQALGEFDQSAARVASGLTNEAQKAHFNQMVNERRLHMQEQLGAYEHSEVSRWEHEVTEGSIAGAIKNAAQNAADPLAVFDNVDLIREVIAHQGAKDNLPPEKIDELQTKAASRAYIGVIGSLVDQGDTAGARASFDQWGKELTADDLSTARGWLKTSETRDESRTNADQIVDSVGPDGDLQSATEALEKRNIADTQVYDQTKRRLIEHYDLKEKAETQRQVSLYDDAATRIQAAPNPLSPDVIPPTQWDQMKGPYQRKLTMLAKATAKGMDIETPPTLFAALEQQKARDPQAFQKRNLTLDPLSKADYRRFSADQADIAKGDPGLVATFETDGQLVDQLMYEGGMTPAKNGKKQSPDEVAFVNQLAKAVTAEQQATGKKLTQDQKTVIGRRLMKAQVLQRGDGSTTLLSKLDDLLPFGFLLPERPATDSYDHTFQSPIAQAYAYSPSQMTASDMVKHRNALVKAGFRPESITDDMVLDNYNESLAEAYRRGK